MAKIKPTTKVVYDYHELVKLVEAKSGKKENDLPEEIEVEISW